ADVKKLTSDNDITSRKAWLVLSQSCFIIRAASLTLPVFIFSFRSAAAFLHITAFTYSNANDMQSVTQNKKIFFISIFANAKKSPPSQNNQPKRAA
ncbi:hypothetical protein, partial [Ruminococcus sp.]